MEIDYLDRYEQSLVLELVQLCTHQQLLSGVLLSAEDIDVRWRELAPEYVADAVTQIQQYPTVSVAWATYLGMAVAHGWDVNWALNSKAAYTSYYGEHKFDDMDEHIVRDVLGLPLESPEASRLENVIRSCAQAAVSRIRHEQIEPQSPMAFHVFVRTAKAMYRIGAAIELKRLGYKFEAMNLPN